MYSWRKRFLYLITPDDTKLNELKEGYFSISFTNGAAIFGAGCTDIFLRFYIVCGVPPQNI